MADVNLTCQWIGPEQDPRRGMVHMCGKHNLSGKNYCEEHYFRVYQKGTAIAGKRKTKELEREIEFLKTKEEIGNLDD
jgi:hypothetical protein